MRGVEVEYRVHEIVSEEARPSRDQEVLAGEARELVFEVAEDVCAVFAQQVGERWDCFTIWHFILMKLI
jgi:hypothetical protein